MIVIDLRSGKRRNLGSLLVRRDREFRLRFLGDRLTKWRRKRPHTPVGTLAGLASPHPSPLKLICIYTRPLGVVFTSPVYPSLRPLCIRLYVPCVSVFTSPVYLSLRPLCIRLYVPCVSVFTSPVYPSLSPLACLSQHEMPHLHTSHQPKQLRFYLAIIEQIRFCTRIHAMYQIILFQPFTHL
jgi:hypothetical protein